MVEFLIKKLCNDRMVYGPYYSSYLDLEGVEVSYDIKDYIPKQNQEM